MRTLATNRQLPSRSVPAAGAVFFAADFFTAAFFTGRLFVAAFASVAFLAVVCFVASDFGYAAAPRFAALAALAFARFANNAALRAGDIFFFTGAVVVAGFSALWTEAHRFFVAAMIAFLPAAESFRLVLGAAAGTAG
jgi:hypothetical protein